MQAVAVRSVSVSWKSQKRPWMCEKALCCTVLPTGRDRLDPVARRAMPRGRSSTGRTTPWPDVGRFFFFLGSRQAGGLTGPQKKGGRSVDGPIFHLFSGASLFVAPEKIVESTIFSGATKRDAPEKEHRHLCGLESSDDVGRFQSTKVVYVSIHITTWMLTYTTFVDWNCVLVHPLLLSPRTSPKESCPLNPPKRSPGAGNAAILKAFCGSPFKTFPCLGRALGNLHFLLRRHCQHNRAWPVAISIGSSGTS